jgi:CspA family cold shock protein
MFYGIIKKISDRGFGFIAQEGGPDVYFHASILPEGEFARLRPEQPVKFSLAKRDPDEKPGQRKGPRAAQIVLIERLPGGTLPRTPQALAPKHHPKARMRKATWKRRINVADRGSEQS